MKINTPFCQPRLRKPCASAVILGIALSSLIRFFPEPSLRGKTDLEREQYVQPQPIIFQYRLDLVRRLHYNRSTTKGRLNANVCTCSLTASRCRAGRAAGERDRPCWHTRARGRMRPGLSHRKTAPELAGPVLFTQRALEACPYERKTVRPTVASYACRGGSNLALEASHQPAPFRKPWPL